MTRAVGPAPLFAFDGAAVEVDGRPLLRGVTASVAARGVTCVLGPSGAGKTTLLRLCNRLEIADAGVVRFRGRDVLELDPLELRRRVGMVFQRPALFPGAVADNLAVAAPDAGRGEQLAALRRAHVPPDLLDRDADALSGGEAQRVCVARALMADPEALLMDEPTASLDPGARGGIERLARDLADAGVAVVWVTHDLAQARRLADDVIVLADGRVLAQGSPALLRESRDPALRDFLDGVERSGGAERTADGAADDGRRVGG